MDTAADKSWYHWRNRRSHKVNTLSYLYITLLSFCAFFPLLQNSLFWTEYDEVNRSFFPTLKSWSSIFSSSVFWNDNPIALASYYIESLIPLPDAFTHRFINILLHSSAAILLFRLLNRMHISGAFLTSLIFTIHPVVVQTLFWPGYRSIIIALCLTLWCIYLALNRKNKKYSNLAVPLSGFIAIIHPIALIIPLILFLNIFVKNKTFKLENFNKVIPYVIVVLILSIISEIFETHSIEQLNLIRTESTEKIPSFNYQLVEYLRIIYFPFGSAFFIPVETHISFFSPYLLFYLALFLIYLFLFLKINTIWGRLLIMGTSLFFTLLIYACCQNGFFLDGAYALDDSLIYITVIPAIAIVTSSINAFVVHRASQFKILWYSIAGMLIVVSTVISLNRSFLYSSPLNVWEYFNSTWSNSVTPKKAMSDYFIINGYNKYKINDHIYFLEFIIRKSPNSNDQKIQLARLYVQDGQDENAQKLYKRIVFEDKNRDIKILEEAADFFELHGIYWDARKTRDLLNEKIQKTRE